MNTGRRLSHGTDGREAEGHERSRPSVFRRYLLAAAFAAGAAIGPSCGSGGPDNVINIPPLSDGGTVMDGGTDGGTCTPQAPVCGNQTLSALLMVSDPPLIVGDYRIKLTDTDEAGGDQRAHVDLLDSCGNVRSSQIIARDSSRVFVIEGTDIEIDVSVTNVTVLEPKSARISATMVCHTDGGVTDGGLDAGEGGSDGGVVDGGVTDGGLDAGEGGSDGGVVDGGVTDGGVTDGGEGGSDGGVVDGGVTDGGVTDGGLDAGEGGSDGGVSDAGPDVTDGGISDAGPDVTDGGEGGSDGGVVDSGTVCPGVFNDTRSGNWPIHVDEPVGGYNIRYMGPVSLNPVFDITCAANGNPVRIGTVVITFVPTNVNIPEDSKTAQFSINAGNLSYASGTVKTVNYP